MCACCRPPCGSHTWLCWRRETGAARACHQAPEPQRQSICQAGRDNNQKQNKAALCECDKGGLTAALGAGWRRCCTFLVTNTMRGMETPSVSEPLGVVM